MRSRQIVFTTFALMMGLGFALVISALLGENPRHVLYVMAHGAFGSPTDLGYSLYYATPLLFTGLSVAWAFRVGLFNIGAEGQMTLGGLAMAATGIYFPHLNSIAAITFALLNAFLVGGIWGALAGWLKVKRGCHEVLVTILLNFVAYGVASFFILSVLRNPDSQVPETARVAPGYEIPNLSARLGGSSPLNWALVLALILVLVYGFVMARTHFGFLQRFTGGAPETARRTGVHVIRHTLLAMFISGGLAGLAAASPVLGFAYRAREGFTGNAGFVGVAVALLGRNTPYGILWAALLIGALNKGALDLDLDTKYVSRDLAVVIQAIILLAVASQRGLQDLISKIFVKFHHRDGRMRGSP